MADKKISALTASTTPLSGTEVLPIVQSGVTKQVSVANLTAGRSVAASQVDVTSGTGYADIAYRATGGFAVRGDGRVDMGGATGQNAYLGIYKSDASSTASYIYVSRQTGVGFALSGSSTTVNLSLVGSSGTINFGNTGVFGGQLALNTATGNFSVASGNLVIGTAGKGIDFSADGQAAGMTSELLDDYEEGAFTPTASGITGDNTYAGTYTIIGNRCMWEIVITTTTSIGITGSGGSSLTPPVTPSNYSTCVAGEATTGGGYGTGLVNTSLIYPPTVAAGVVVIITGSFSVA